MELTYQEVLEILRIVDASSCQELILELGDIRLVVRKTGSNGAAVSEVRALGAASAAAVDTSLPPNGSPPVPAPPAVEPPRANRPAVSPGAPSAHPNARPVRSPMVGRFYRAPAPGAPPFVEVGSVVSEDDTVCIIEVMKLLTQVKAGMRGRVVAICAENGQMVEFGQELILIDAAE